MKKITKLIIAALVMLMLSGCTASKQYVTYTAYPIGYLLNRIGGDNISTVSIQNNKMMQLANIKADYDEILDNSSVFFYINGLEPYRDLYEEEVIATGVERVDLSTLNALYDFKRYTMVYVNGSQTYVEGPYYEDDLFDTIDTYDLDPFIWLDPIGMLSMAKDINEYLTSNYVELSSYFNANYNALSNELIALDAAYQNLASRLRKENKTIKFVSMSSSFGCWQKAFGFQVYPVCLSKYGALPSKQELDVIKQKIVADNVKYIAYEPNMSEDMMNLYLSLEAELGLKRVTLSNISSLTEGQMDANKNYMTLMYENLSVLENMAVSILEN